MPKKPRAKRGSAKNVLRLPDLDHSKTSVLQSLGSVASKRSLLSPDLAASIRRVKGAKKLVTRLGNWEAS
jgi:hypothetical protein